MYQTLKKLRLKTLLVSALLLASNAFAAQRLVPQGDETLTAQISRTEATLLRVDGQQIRRVFGAEGEFAIVPDAETGNAFIRPTTEKQTISVYVADHGGNTYKLLLAITPGPADPIVIKSLPTRTASKDKINGRDVPRTQAIKRMIVALEADDSLGFDANAVNRVIPLWNEALFVLRKVIDAGSIKGERYSLTNTSKQPMVIDEREFYRRGVIAVAVTKPNLTPGQSTDVDIVSESGDE